MKKIAVELPLEEVFNWSTLMLNEDIRVWVQENASSFAGWQMIHWGEDNGDSAECVEFLFKTAEEATLFKLTFG